MAGLFSSGMWGWKSHHYKKQGDRCKQFLTGSASSSTCRVDYYHYHYYYYRICSLSFSCRESLWQRIYHGYMNMVSRLEHQVLILRHGLWLTRLQSNVTLSEWFVLTTSSQKDGCLGDGRRNLFLSRTDEGRVLSSWWIYFFYLLCSAVIRFTALHIPGRYSPSGLQPWPLSLLYCKKVKDSNVENNMKLSSQGFVCYCFTLSRVHKNNKKKAPIHNNI